MTAFPPDDLAAQAERLLDEVLADPADEDASTLPPGHPLPWGELVPYERQQGGYWLYGPHCDVYGNGKIWVPVRNPEWGPPEPGFEQSDAFLAGWLQGLAEGRRIRGGRNPDGTVREAP